MSALGRTRMQQTHRVAWAPEKKITVKVVLALALLLIIGVVSYQAMVRFKRAEQREARVEAALGKLEAILSQLKDAEIGQQVYLMTGDEWYL
jgi:CHASE3 domain sensor protein